MVVDIRAASASAFKANLSRDNTLCILKNITILHNRDKSQSVCKLFVAHCLLDGSHRASVWVLPPKHGRYVAERQ